MPYYDNQCFLEISRTPQAVLIVSFSKVSSAVVSIVTAKFVSSGFYFSQNNIEVDYDSYEIKTIIKAPSFARK